MQLQLIKPPPFCPAPFGKRQYVAALQNKSGELAALAEASEETWEHLTPLIQIVGPRDKTKPLLRPTVASWIKRVSEAVGSHPCFIDTLRLRSTRKTQPSSGGQPVLAVIYEECRRRGLRFVPVLALESQPAHQRIVADAVAQDGRGVCLRLSVRKIALPPGYTVSRMLTATLEQLGTTVSEADLVVDLGFLDPNGAISLDLTRTVDSVAATGEWRTLVLLGTSMPQTLSCIGEGTVGSLPRHEWRLWQQLEDSRDTRIPTFGDYGIQHPTPPHDGGPGMRANIRYTVSDATVIARKGPVIQEGSAQYRELCARLVTMDQFRGRAFSWGDKILADCADGVIPPRAQQMWRGVGTSHHLRFVCDQLMSLGTNA